ncbi:hypothetical protein WDW86_17580, partial [Bdellovibrionota bacterium FG-2]
FSRHYPLNPLKTLHDYVISADEQSMGRWQARSQLFEKLWTHLTLVCFISGQVLLGFEAAAADTTLRYQARPGDTLGEVLNSLGVCPLWGPGRSVERAAKLNPHLKKSSGNFIFRGQWIYLPVQKLSNDPDFIVHEDGHVEFLTSAPVSKCKAGFSRISTPRLATEPSVQSVMNRVIASEVTEVKQNDQVVAPAPAAPATNPAEPALPTQPTASDQYSLISVTPILSFSRLDATDLSSGGTFSFLSGTNYGANFGWHPVFSENFAAEVSAGFLSTTYSIASTTKTLDPSSVVLGHFSFEGKSKISKAISVGALAGERQSAFARGKSNTELALDSVALPELGLWVDGTFYQGALFSSGMKLSARFKGPGSTDSYTINSGYLLGGEFWIAQDFKNHNAFRTGLFYEVTQQKTSITSQSYSEIGVFFSLDWNAFSP